MAKSINLAALGVDYSTYASMPASASFFFNFAISASLSISLASLSARLIQMLFVTIIITDYEKDVKPLQYTIYVLHLYSIAVTRRYHSRLIDCLRRLS